MNEWLVAAIAFTVGALVCRAVAAEALRRPSAKLIRTNVDGLEVPAVLGWPIVAGSLVALVFVAIWNEQTFVATSVNHGYRFFLELGDSFEWIPLQLTAAVALLLFGMYRAGLWDDLRGDERPRGYRGHLEALRGGRVTGGAVKLAVGGIIGVLVAWMTLGGFRPLPLLVLIALSVPLGANLLNLFDRAPGRAGKMFLVLAIPLATFGDPLWRTIAAGAIGGISVLLPIDLRAKGMLGDAGANPLGGLLGLGLAVNLAGATWSVLALVVVLLALNLASEKWSFSAIIARNRVLAWLDHLGRE